MSHQLGGIEPKDKHLVISFCIGEGGAIPQLNLRSLQDHSENFLFKD